MDPIILQQLKDSWFKKQNELMQKRPPRRYLHFDRPIPVLGRKDLNRITSKNLIKSHSFFPLLKFAKSNRVYQRDKVSKIKIIDWKERPISYASHFDSLVYSWYAFQLEYYYESRLRIEHLEESVIAYRKLGKSNIDLAMEVFEFIRKNSECSALAMDIKGFYDNLDFAFVKKSWKETLGVINLPSDHYAVYKSITKYSYVRLREVSKALKIGLKDFRKSSLFLGIKTLDILREKNKIKSNKTRGIPQGTPISCVLSNLYMFDFDKTVNERVLTFGGLYRRYSDDIVIVCPKPHLKDLEIFVQDKIEKLQLEIQKTKTEIRHFSRNQQGLECFNEQNKLSKLQYLGVDFYGERVFLRHKGYARFERRMKNAIVGKLIKSRKYKIPFFKRKIYETYSPLGRKNYFSYTNSATEKLKQHSFEIQNNRTCPDRILKKINKKIKKELRGR